MEHPLIGNLSDLKDEELQSKISELNNKLVQAYRFGNTQLINQLHMALESYKGQLQQRQNAQNTDSGHNDKIDIS